VQNFPYNYNTLFLSRITYEFKIFLHLFRFFFAHNSSVTQSEAEREGFICLSADSVAVAQNPASLGFVFRHSLFVVRISYFVFIICFFSRLRR